MSNSCLDGACIHNGLEPQYLTRSESHSLFNGDGKSGMLHCVNEGEEVLGLK